MSYHSNCNVLLHWLPVDGAENNSIFKINLICFNPFAPEPPVTARVDPHPLHLDQKAAKCTTCKPVCGKF